MKKTISLILSLCMLLSMLSGIDLSAFASEEISNRAEWLSKLTQIFDMTVEDDNYPDNYFSDLSSDSEYYYDVLLAAEFGLIDVKAGGAVNPNGDITREFAAQTLNFCLGWELENEEGKECQYTFSDWESCEYPDDDQIAVNRGWFELNSENAFSPNKEVTASEIMYMINDASQTLEGDKVDDNYEGTVKYNDGVIEVADDIAVDFNENEVVIHSNKYNIKENDTFVVYSNGLPVVYTAKKVAVNSGSITVKTVEENSKEAIKDIDLQTVFDVDAKDIVPADGVLIEDKSNAFSSPKGSKKVENSITLTLKKELSEGKSFKFSVKVSDIKCSVKLNSKNKQFIAKASFNTAFSVEGDITGIDLNDYLPDEFGEIPIAGVGFFEIKPDVKITGKIKLSQSYHSVVGFSMNGNDVHKTISFKKDKFYLLIEVTGRIGLKFEVGIKMLPVKAGIYLEVGVTSKVSSKITKVSGNTINCVTLAGYLHLNVGFEIKIDLVVWDFKEKYDVEIFKESNSPVRLYFHFENGKLVQKCTAGNNYITPADSPYGDIVVDENGENANYTENYSLNYSIFNKEVTIRGYSGNPVNIIIPSKINGYPVTFIHGVYNNIYYDHGAFENCTGLQSVIIPDSVKRIGESAFSGCTGLENIIIPDGVTDIGIHAFSKCVGLKNVTLPNSLVSIGNYAFSGCTGLENIIIPDGVTEIKNGTFNGCTELKNLKIPDAVTNIGRSAFSDCTGLKSVTLPNSLTSIREYAFSGCTGLESVIIPDSITELRDGVFEGCTGLKSIIVPKGVTEIDSSLFSGCTSIRTLTIPESVTNIKYSAFNNCTGLKDVYYNGTEESWNDIYIEDNNDCIINATIHFINGESSDNTPKTDSLVIDGKCGDNITYSLDISEDSPVLVLNGSGDMYDYSDSNPSPWNNYKAYIKSVEMSDEITSIGKNAFSGCSDLTEVYLPSSLEKIETGAFNGCDNIVTIKYGGNESHWNNVIINDNNIVGALEKVKILGVPELKCELSKYEFVYNKKTKKPKVRVYDDSGNTLRAGTDYTVSYSKGRKLVGTYAVTVSYIGDYADNGEETLYFTIKPKGTSIKKLYRLRKGFKVRWKKQSIQTSGYQIQYSRYKSFKKPKTVTVKGARKTLRSIRKLTRKKTYYVRIRTYKTVNGEKIYSSWSKAKKVKTK